MIVDSNKPFFFQEGVALAADTRATGGSTVGDKNCEKIHNLAPNIFCCGAGTAADCDHVTGKSKRKKYHTAKLKQDLIEINQVLYSPYRDD